jgi:hypothetical protein
MLLSFKLMSNILKNVPLTALFTNPAEWEYSRSMNGFSVRLYYWFAERPDKRALDYYINFADLILEDSIDIRTTKQLNHNA